MSLKGRCSILVVAVVVLAWGLLTPATRAQHFRAAGDDLGIGDVSADIIFTPLTPCRLIDTRLAGGTFVANETRHYDLIGPANYASTGGNPAGCGIPATTTPVTSTTYGNRVRSLVLNLTAVLPSANGNLRAWPTNQAVPLASVLNYSPTMYAVANGIALQTCDAAVGAGTPCLSGDLSIRADTGGTDLVVDVLGYYAPVSFLLASNRTLRGHFAIDYTATGANQYGVDAIPFLPPLATIAAAGTPNIILPGGAPTANCPGTTANPSAAPGQLCLYAFQDINTSLLQLYRMSIGSAGTTDPYAATLLVGSTAAGRVSFLGVWAVTAP
jgi:hypothetical protein